MAVFAVDDCAKFHGHFCAGVTIGYVMSRFAMEQIGAKPDDDLYCVAEFQNCMTDAVQCVTGCTAGKGNLAVKNYGKRAMTLVHAATGEGVRVHVEITFPENLSKEESAKWVLTLNPAEICRAVPVKIEVPQRKQLTYVRCDNCMEEFAQFCGVQVGSQFCCPECAAKLQ